MINSLTAVSFIQDPIFILAGKSSLIYDNLGYFLAGGATLLVAAGAVGSIFRVLDVVMKSDDLRLPKDVQPEAQEVRSEENWWSNIFAGATKAVPIAREQEILLDHDYDGIKELDNNLPPWWLAMFYVTIVMGVTYFSYHHLTDWGMTQEEVYLQEVETAKAAVKAYVSGQAVSIDENSVVALTDEASIEEGEFIYKLNCVVCHLESGGGLVGPNLTDEYWLHGGSIQDIFSTVKYGVPEKGMIAWANQLRPAEMQKVSSYILSLAGTNPPNAKEPQGEKYVPGESGAAEGDAVE